MPQVIIRHPKTGQEYEIDSAAFRRRKAFAEPDGTVKTYAEAGFTIVSLADGSPYQEPQPRADKD
jgi:hypothetical protein